MIYGPRKKNMIKHKSEPTDFIHGKIYEVKPEF